jgi:hypothetical protein
MKYFFREYKKDLTVTLLTIISTIFTFFKFTDNPKVKFFLSLAIIFISLIAIIYFRMKEKDFHFVSFKNRKNKDDWIGRGVFEYSRTEKCFLIQDSDGGYIYSKALTWSDYKVSFDFKL